MIVDKNKIAPKSKDLDALKAQCSELDKAVEKMVDGKKIFNWELEIDFSFFPLISASSLCFLSYPLYPFLSPL